MKVDVVFFEKLAVVFLFCSKFFLHEAPSDGSAFGHDFAHLTRKLEIAIARGIGGFDKKYVSAGRGPRETDHDSRRYNSFSNFIVKALWPKPLDEVSFSNPDWRKSNRAFAFYFFNAFHFSDNFSSRF